MSKLIKIKESEVFRVITKIISEQAAGEIKVTATNDLGTHPEFKGLKTLLVQLKSNVQKALSGKIPYRIKTDVKTGTVKPLRQGNALSLEVTLIPCEETQRHYFFDGAAGIYSYINTTSVKAVHSKVRTAVMDKATASFADAEVQELYPNLIGLRNFTGLNTVEPDKQYKLILKFLVGKRPDGYYDVGDEEPVAASVEKIEPTAASTPAEKTQATAAAATVTSSDKKTEATNESGKPVSAGWEGANIDDAHNVKPFIANIQKGLEDFWKSGKNPIVEDIEMTVSKNANGSYTTKTKANIKESKDGMAWVGFESRGSAGEGYKERADDQYNGGRYDDKGRPVLKDGKQVNKGQTANKKDGTPNPCYGKSLAKCMQDHVGAGEVKLVATIEDASIPCKQYFVTFTKPQNFPPK